MIVHAYDIGELLSSTLALVEIHTSKKHLRVILGE